MTLNNKTGPTKGVYITWFHAICIKLEPLGKIVTLGVGIWVHNESIIKSTS